MTIFAKYRFAFFVTINKNLSNLRVFAFWTSALIAQLSSIIGQGQAKKLMAISSDPFDQRFLSVCIFKNIYISKMKEDATIHELLHFFVYRWQKGKLLLLASLSCWIIFTLPLGFVQPPPTSCMIRKNDTPYLAASNREQRIVKRSIDDELYYPEHKEEFLEVASNVVFERLRRNTDDNEIFDYVKKPKKFSASGSYDDIKRNGDKDFDNGGSTMYDLRNNRVRRQTSTDKDDVGDLGSLSESSDVNARGIDLEMLQKKNRPADVLEYKRFMKVQTFMSFLYMWYKIYNT